MNSKRVSIELKPFNIMYIVMASETDYYAEMVIE